MKRENQPQCPSWNVRQKAVRSYCGKFLGYKTERSVGTATEWVGPENIPLSDGSQLQKATCNVLNRQIRGDSKQVSGCRGRGGGWGVSADGMGFLSGVTNHNLADVVNPTELIQPRKTFQSILRVGRVVCSVTRVSDGRGGAPRLSAIGL